MSQSAASRLLTDLEEIIGSPLFDRLPRGVRPNWYGLSVIRHARNALTSLTEAASEIELLKSGRTGQVSIGTVAGPAIDFVPRAIARVAEAYPLMRIHLQEEPGEQLLDSLLAGRIEIGVGRLDDRHDKSHFNYVRLADESFCPIVRNGHPFLERDEVGITDLASAPWIVPPVGSDLRHRFDLMFRDAGHSSPTRLIEAVSSALVSRLVQETGYLAVMAREVAEYFSAHGLISILDVPLACGMDSLGLVTRKDWLLSPAACAVCEAIEEAAATGRNDRPPRVPRVAEPDKKFKPMLEQSLRI